jgi:hypothetical protein
MSVNLKCLTFVLFTLTFFLSLLLCSTPQYGGGVETTNGITIAIKESQILGTAPAGSQIVICDTAYTPYITSQMHSEISIDTAFADEYGKFKLDLLPDGCYNLTGRNYSADSGAIIKDICINRMNTTESIKSVEYMLIGSITGTAFIGSECTGSVLVYIRGTDLWDTTENSGIYTIENIPAGKFTINAYCKKPSKIPGMSDYYTLKIDNVTVAGNVQTISVDLNLEKVN